MVEIVPLLRDFAAAVDLHGIWLTVHHIYDEEIDQLHDPLVADDREHQPLSQDACLDLQRAGGSSW